MADRVTRLNRRVRRSHGALRRREERHEAAHLCKVLANKAQAGLERTTVDVTVTFYHDLHRVLGEPRCPHCPRCLALKRLGRIDRKPADAAGIRHKWELLLEAARCAP